MQIQATTKKFDLQVIYFKFLFDLIDGGMYYIVDFDLFIFLWSIMEI